MPKTTAHAGQAAAAAATSETPFAIAIGAPWPGLEGSAYAGQAKGQNGEPDYHLVLLADKPSKPLNWKDGLEWARGIGADLPTRDESALLYAFLRDHFEQNYWHWTGTQYSSGYAWSQYFDCGNQGSNDKSYEARCRAVRRFVLQSFSSSNDAPLDTSDARELLSRILTELQGGRADLQKIFLADIGAQP